MRRLLPFVVLGLLLCTACAKPGRVQRDIVIGKEAYNVMMPTGSDVEHPVHGKEVWFGMGPMSGKGEVKANGVAQAHVFADGSSIATVNLNIEIAPKGSVYIPWLQKPGTTERVRLEELLNPMKDVRYLITADVPTDVRAWSEVVVTLEKASGPSAGDPVVATGVLTERTR